MSAHPSTSKSATAPAPRHKLVIRRLPPTLPEAVFWKSIEPWTQGKSTWKRFIKGHPGEGHDVHAVHSRAYVVLTSDDATTDLYRNYDGHVFRSKTGTEYQAVVEYAPVQKTPHKSKVKTDARQGTIEEDPDFQSFLQSLNAPAVKPVLEASIPAPQPTSTPLLDHLRAHGRTNKSRTKGDTSSSAGPQAVAINKVENQAPGAGSTSKPKQGGKGSDTAGGQKKGKGKKKRTGSHSSEGHVKPTVPPASAFPSLNAQLPPKRVSPIPPKSSTKGVPLNMPGKSSAQSHTNPAGAENTSLRGRGRGRGRGDSTVARGGGVIARGGNGRGDATSDSQDIRDIATIVRGRGRGRGTSGPERTAQGSIVQILSRNADSDRGRGRGTALGGGTNAVLPPSEARIDM